MSDDVAVASVFDAFGIGICRVDLEGRFTYMNPAGARLLGWRPEELLGKRAHELIHHSRPDGSPFPCDECPVYEAVVSPDPGRELDGIAEPERVDVFWTKDRSPVPVAYTIARLQEDGRHAGAIILFADISERRRDTDLLRAHAAQQAAVAELGLTALRGGSLQPLLERASVVVAETLEVEFSEVLELEPGEAGLRLRAGVGWREGLVGNITVGLGGGSIGGLAVVSDRPVLVDDLDSDARVHAPRLNEHDVLSGVSVVIRGREHPWGTEAWGTLGAHSRERHAFSEDDLNFLHAVANTLALAIERNEAERELRRRNSEISGLADQLAKLADERRRIMADALEAEEHTRESISQLLHDEVLQSLLTARQDLAKAIQTGDANDAVIAQAREAVMAAISELRNAVVALHPVTLERLGLASAIEAVARLHGMHAGFDLALDLAPVAVGELDQLIVSLAQELLSNVARHAEASSVAVSLARVGEELVFEVSDDGRGIDPGRPGAALEQGHVGLASIARRVEAAGGRFKLSANAGGGTRARIVLPALS